MDARTGSGSVERERTGPAPSGAAVAVPLRPAATVRSRARSDGQTVEVRTSRRTIVRCTANIPDTTITAPTRIGHPPEPVGQRRRPGRSGWPARSRCRRWRRSRRPSACCPGRAWPRRAARRRRRRAGHRDHGRDADVGDGDGRCVEAVARPVDVGDGEQADDRGDGCSDQAEDPGEHVERRRRPSW